MKKIKFIFFNISIIVFILALFSFAEEPKNVSSSAKTGKATPAATTAVAKSKAQPAPAATVTPAKGKAQPTSTPTAVSDKSKAQPAPTAANATVQRQIKTVPAQTQIKPPVTPAAKVTVPAPAKAAIAVAPPTGKQTATASPTKVPPPAPPVPSQGAIPGYSLVDQANVNAYSYNPLGKPDPFLPFIEVELAKQKAKKEESEKKAAVSIFPLQRAETDMYKVVGIVGSEDHRVAIAEDTAQKFYPLLIGTRIGLRNGKVVEILADRVIVEEYENNKGKKVILKLRKN